MSRRLQTCLLGLALVVAGSGCDGSLEELVESTFPDMHGLESPLSGKQWIVGARGAPGFRQLHCCWVGTRTGWRNVGKSWSLERKSEIDAQATALIGAFIGEVELGAVDFVDAEVEDFSRDKLNDPRHLKRSGHCNLHDDGECEPEEICIDALKAGTVEINLYQELQAGVSAELPRESTTIKIGGSDYLMATSRTDDVILGFKMAETSCDEEVWLEPEDGPLMRSSSPVQGEDYQDHLERWRASLPTAGAEPETSQLVPPSRDAHLRRARVATAKGLITPPDAHIPRGGLIRITTTADDGKLKPPTRPLQVTSVSLEGVRTQRTTETGLDGGAWLTVDHDAAKISISTDERVLAQLQPVSGMDRLPTGGPSIDQVTDTEGNPLPGVVDADRRFAVLSEDRSVWQEIRVGTERVAPLAAGAGYALLAPIERVGPYDIEVIGFDGVHSAPLPVQAVRLKVVEAPPKEMEEGQRAAIVLRLEGTAKPVSVRFDSVSGGLRFDEGGRSLVARSSGGVPNRVRVSVTARESGDWNISYRIASR